MLGHKHLILTALAALTLLSTACNVAAPDIVQVQVNLVDKSIFEGEWWTAETTIDADAEATALGGTWNGDAGFGDMGVDKQGLSITQAKIRWVIDEDFLLAYRSYELIDGGNDDGRDDNFRGQPLAAFPIESHVDIRKQFNGLTGEETNVTAEDTSSRRWYERSYMRVNWSRNSVKSYFYKSDLAQLGRFQRESISFDIQESGAHSSFPKAYEPQFVRIGEDADYRFNDEWPAGMEDTVHYMSFVTMTMLSPGTSCFSGTGICSTVAFPTRMSFLRVPPEHEFAAETQSHDEFDRFGLFRLWQRTYVRGGKDVSTRPEFCRTNDDCGGHYCDISRGEDPATGVCIGGLTQDFGETDFLTFYRPRHNVYKDHFRKGADGETISCVADWECDGRFSGFPGESGSKCDRGARVCTIPPHAREARQSVYHLNAGYPKHLVKAAFEVVGNWNEAFMRGYRATRQNDGVSVPVPNYGDFQQACQTADPTSYCYCGAAEDTNGQCRMKFNPFNSPADYEAAGVTAPYDCQIVNAEEGVDPQAPTAYEDYPIPGTYRYNFVGEECILILKSNLCDENRTEAGQSCDDVMDPATNLPVKYQQLGDIRYQFFNFVDQAFTPFGGVANPMADPQSGELVTANINFSAGSVENVGSLPLQYFPVLRCESDAGCAPGDDVSADEYLSGEDLRDYFSRLGRTEHPNALAASGSDGFSTDDPSRPGLPVNLSDHLNDHFENIADRAESLRGMDGRANIMSDRLGRLKGTKFESQMMDALGEGFLHSVYGQGDERAARGFSDQMDIHDEAVLDKVSPFRGNLLNTLMEPIKQQQLMGQLNMCPMDSMLFNDRFWAYWAEAFRSRTRGEAGIRMQQLYTRMVMHHELGHSVGLRHNFGASFDRDNYGEGYFNAIFKEGSNLALPKIDNYDRASLGGNENSFVDGPEIRQYTEDLREVRNARAAAGLHNWTTASTMDYNGDTSDAQGLGRYDIAAVVYNHYNMIEAYTEDPEYQSTSVDSLDGLKVATTPRTWVKFYQGGESCVADTECPNRQGAAGLAPNQPFQRCVQNPRVGGRRPQACGGEENCVCSNIDNDLVEAELGNNIYPDRVFGIDYLFCSDTRTNDISWCSRQDTGESFQEQVDHFRRSWEERYPRTYYRRFRVGGARGLGSFSYILDAVKVYQHLFFRANFEDGFRQNTGPLGFLDQTLASYDAMNWFSEMVNLPDEGSYTFDASQNMYRHVSESPDAPGSDFSLRPGQGFGMWTKYQAGHQGFFRPERAGVFFDKYLAMLALAQRDWNLSFTVDERYFINYYDLFPLEMTEFFGGVATNNERWFAPRVSMEGGEPTIEHMAINRLDFIFAQPNGTPSEVRSQAERYTGPSLGGTSNEILRTWATILALAQFPVFYDTSFEQRLIIYKLNNGSGFTISDTRPDGTPTCAYMGPNAPAASPLGHPTCADRAEADYVVFVSDRFNTPYIAVKVKPDLNFNPEEEQLGFQILANLADLQAEVGAGGASTELRRRLESDQSFLEYLIDLQAQYGISNFF